MTEANRLNNDALARYRCDTARQVTRTDIDSLLSHIEWLEGEMNIDNHLLQVEVGSLRKQLEAKAPMPWDDSKPNFWRGAWKYSPSDVLLEMCVAYPNMALEYMDEQRGIAESTRTLLIEVVKGIRDYYQAEAQTTGSANRAPADRAVIAVDEIIAALESAELKQDSESVKMKAQT